MSYPYSMERSIDPWNLAREENERESRERAHEAASNALLEAVERNVDRTLPVYGSARQWPVSTYLGECSREAQALRKPGTVLVSAVTGEGVRPLLELIEGRLGAGDTIYEVMLDPQDGQGQAWLHDRGEVLSRRNFADGRKTFEEINYDDPAQFAAEQEAIRETFMPLVDKCKALGRAMRIGTNHGSLSDRIMNRYGDSPHGMVESALEFIRIAESHGFRDMVLSMKSSNPKVMVAAYRLAAARMTELGMDYPLHRGVTEAGEGEDARIKSAIGIGALLADGLGDTIRVSLTPQPGESRTQEVVIASEILQSLGLRTFVPSVTACPGCGRTTSTTFQEMAKSIDDFLRAQMPVWRTQYPGVENLKVAVMGCIVNGPGESKHADIGISLPGSGEAPAAPVFIDGEKAMTLRGDNIAQEFHQIVETYIEKRFG